VLGEAVRRGREALIGIVIVGVVGLVLLVFHSVTTHGPAYDYKPSDMGHDAGPWVVTEWNTNSTSPTITITTSASLTR